MKTTSTPVKFDSEVEFHRCTPLVARIARQFAARVPPNVTFDDLVQAGLIGLLEASRRFDPATGVPFEAYATPRIRGAMTDELRTHDYLPRQRRRELRKVDEASRRLAQDLGRPASESEIARELRRPVAEVQTIVAEGDFGRPIASSWEEDGEQRSALDFVAAEGTDPIEHYADKEFRSDLAAAIERLPERERMVMGLYYEQDLNLREIAAVLDVTESRVCQIHRQAVERLQDALVAWREPVALPQAQRARRHA